MSNQLGSVNVSVTGGANALATATQIPVGQVFTKITDGLADTAVKLPVDKIGSIYIIKNTSGTSKNIYPPNSESRIDSAGNKGSLVALANGASIQLVCCPNNIIAGPAQALGTGGVQYFSF